MGQETLDTESLKRLLIKKIDEDRSFVADVQTAVRTENESWLKGLLKKVLGKAYEIAVDVVARVVRAFIMGAVLIG